MKKNDIEMIVTSLIPESIKKRLLLNPDYLACVDVNKLNVLTSKIQRMHIKDFTLGYCPECENIFVIPHNYF